MGDGIKSFSRLPSTPDIPTHISPLLHLHPRPYPFLCSTPPISTNGPHSSSTFRRNKAKNSLTIATSSTHSHLPPLFLLLPFLVGFVGKKRLLFFWCSAAPASSSLIVFLFVILGGDWKVRFFPPFSFWLDGV